MKIKGIKYTAPLLDNSGYAQASRGNVLALHKLGVPLTLNPISFEQIKPDLGENGKIIGSLINKEIDYNVNIIHTTPEFWSEHREEGKINIGYTIWETTLLHPDWPKFINENVDAVMVGCEWNVEVFRDSGVSIPIFVVPHGIGTQEFDNIESFDVAGVSNESYMFYGIFQWTERKHPLAIIKAYWHAFQKDEDVALVLKTYRNNYTDGEKDAVRTTIQRLKKVTPMDKYPPIYLIPHMLTNDEILGLHARGDCYVSLDRGEGFGLSPFAAGACGNPIMVTNFGGSTEYAKENNSYLIDYMLTPVFGMPWCMSVNSLVKTDKGYVRALDLCKGDVVINKSLEFKKIDKTEVRPLTDDESIYSLKYYSMFDPIEVTSEHKLNVLNDENKPVKKKVSDINVDDYLYIPKPKISIDTPTEMQRLEKQFDHEIYSHTFYLSGLYLAEGYVDKNNYYVNFSFNINERYTLGAECIEFMKELFDIKEEKIHDRVRENINSYDVSFHDKAAVEFFKHSFGSGSHFKHIPDDFKYNEYNDELLRGYWAGDGHIRKPGYKNIRTGKKRISPECVASTASIDLALDLRDVLLSRGIVSSFYKYERSDNRIGYVISVSNELFDRIMSIKDANRISNRHYIVLPDGMGFGVRINKKELLEDYDDFICSISVEPGKEESKEDSGGSYILNGIASSNSPWYRGDQLWAEPDIKHGADTMKYIFENQAEAKSKGQLLKKDIFEHFAWEVIGQKIIDVVKEI